MGDNWWDIQQILTVSEVAEMLKVNPQTIRNFIHSGDLQAKKIGRGYKIRESDLQQFIKEQYDD